MLGSNIEQMSASSLGPLFADCDAELLGVAVVPDDSLTVVDVGDEDFALAACELFVQPLKLTTLTAATTTAIDLRIERPRATNNVH